MPAALALTSLLFTPGNRPDRFAKAAECGADGIIVDLEDSIGAAEKDAVRAGVIDHLRRHPRIGPPPFVTTVRVNCLRTPEGTSDLDALQQAAVAPDAVMLPKVESAMEVQLATTKLPESVRLVVLIETVLGVRFVNEIAAASPRLVALAFGGLDLSAETGGEPTWDALLWPRTAVVHACAAAGLRALDQPFIDFRNDAGLTGECVRSRELGFTGRLAIHPRQCPLIAAAYRPTAAQIDRARRIVATYDSASGGVANLDGEMIDVPIYKAAVRILDRAGR